MSARFDVPWLRSTIAFAVAVLVASSGGRADACEHHHPAAPTTPAKDGARPATPGGPAAPARAAYARSERTYDVPDVTLLDQAARPVRLRDLLGADEPVMVNFVFTTCTAICPVMSGIFARVAREHGPDGARLRLVSISIDPEQDTPARLQAYAERFGAAPGWTFLTGAVRDVEGVERAFDAYRGDKMNHEPLTLLRGGPGRPWVRIDGFASPAELARELERARAKVALR